MSDTSLPFEIWQQIVDFAIDPDRNDEAGYTADALAATNRMLHTQVSWSTRHLPLQSPSRMVASKLGRRHVQPTSLVQEHCNDMNWLAQRYELVTQQHGYFNSQEQQVTGMSFGCLLFLAYHHASPFQTQFRELLEQRSTIIKGQIDQLKNIGNAVLSSTRQWLHLETAWKYRFDACFCCKRPILLTSLAIRYVPQQFPILFCSTQCLSSPSHLLSMISSSKVSKEYQLNHRQLQTIVPAITNGTSKYYYRFQLLRQVRMIRHQPFVTEAMLKVEKEARARCREARQSLLYQDHCNRLKQARVSILEGFDMYIPPCTLRALPNYVSHASYWWMRTIPNEWLENTLRNYVIDQYCKLLSAKMVEENDDNDTEGKHLLQLFLQWIFLNSFPFSSDHSSSLDLIRSLFTSSTTLSEVSQIWSHPDFEPFRPWSRARFPLFIPLPPLMATSTSLEKRSRVKFNTLGRDQQSQAHLFHRYCIHQNYLFDPKRYIQALQTNSNTATTDSTIMTFYAIHSTEGDSSVYSSWRDCSEHLERCKYNKANGKRFHKKFETCQEAEQFAKQGPSRRNMTEFANTPYAKRNEPRRYVPKIHREKIEKLTYEEFIKTLPSSNTHLVVYTDGSCSGTGTEYAQAGYGVWFGPLDSRNISEPLNEEDASLKTAQRAELKAMVEALKIVQGDQRIISIRSDSEYVVKGATSWLDDWKNRNWMTKGTDYAPSKPVSHQDLWKELDQLQSNLIAVEYFHIPGHQGEFGNEAVDQLAREGRARCYKPSTPTGTPTSNLTPTPPLQRQLGPNDGQTKVIPSQTKDQVVVAPQPMERVASQDPSRKRKPKLIVGNEEEDDFPDEACKVVREAEKSKLRTPKVFKQPKLSDLPAVSSSPALTQRDEEAVMVAPAPPPN